MPRIKFKRLVISPTYGNCDTGDIVSCGEAFAVHCVNDLQAAEYLEAPKKPRRKRRVKRNAANP